MISILMIVGIDRVMTSRETGVCVILSNCETLAALITLSNYLDFYTQNAIFALLFGCVVKIHILRFLGGARISRSDSLQREI